MLYGTPLLVLVMFILRFPTAGEFGLILFAMFLLSMGISGLAISLAVAFRSFERFTTARSLLYLMLVFCSTVFYPITVLQQILPRSLMVLAQWNPLSRVSDIVRGYLIGIPVITLQSWVELLLFSAVFILSGAGMYAAAMERSTN
jgi:ABC-type polysaccharide/polyol phosphate export permease